MTFFDRFSAPHLIGAHRGCRACRPENTLSAFSASIGRCHFIEIDVQISRDGIPVVIHDPSLTRTTDAMSRMHDFGVNSMRVSSWNFEQLQQLDAGGWFLKTDPFATVASGMVTTAELEGLPPQRIQSLEELLNWAVLHKMPVNIELKHQHKIVFDQHIVSFVLDIIDRTAAAPMVLISSFDHDYLFQCKALAPHISIGVLQDEQHPPELVSYLKAIGAAAYHPDDAITSRELIRTLRSAGIGINVYTVNDKKRQQELFAYGATAVFTDFPELPAV
jgi:glycerophosphoryl diester phosphodiesterase